MSLVSLDSHFSISVHCIDRTSDPPLAESQLTSFWDNCYRHLNIPFMLINTSRL